MKTGIRKPAEDSDTAPASIQKQARTLAMPQIDRRVGSLLQRLQCDAVQNSPAMTLQRRQLEQLSVAPAQRQVEEEEELQSKFASTIQRLTADVSVPNRTGMPDNLKSGIEALSGLDVSDVRVHRNSSKPLQLNALAYAQGNDIHLGPGQEQHLPHEAWHVVQQAQGRVRPTMQMGGEQINNNVGLEREADVMGLKASQAKVEIGKDIVRDSDPLKQTHVVRQNYGHAIQLVFWDNDEVKFRTKNTENSFGDSAYLVEAQRYTRFAPVNFGRNLPDQTYFPGQPRSFAYDPGGPITGDFDPVGLVQHGGQDRAKFEVSGDNITFTAWDGGDSSKIELSRLARNDAEPIDIDPSQINDGTGEVGSGHVGLHPGHEVESLGDDLPEDITSDEFKSNVNQVKRLVDSGKVEMAKRFWSREFTEWGDWE